MMCWLLLVAYGVSAQGAMKSVSGRSATQRSDMYDMLCNKIVEMLSLDGERKDSFEAIYSEYVKDTRSRGHGGGAKGRFPKGGITPMSQTSESLTEEQIEAQIIDSFDQAIHSIEVKKEYYTKFRGVLSPSEISQMYEFERRIRDRALEEQRRRIHGGGGREMPYKK